MEKEKKTIFILKNRFLLHLGFWTAFLVFPFLGEVESGSIEFSLNKAYHFLIHYTGFVLACYFNLYYLIPKYLENRNFVVYSVYLIFTVALSTIIFIAVQNLIEKFIIKNPENEDDLFLFFHLSFFCIFLITITSLFYLLRRWINYQEIKFKLNEAEKQKIVSELKVLKAQINPHFLFNTLNHIYSLALENNPKTPEVVLKLAELMNYILYDSQAEKISLKKEIEFIKNYIDLEKARYEDSVLVEFYSDKENVESMSISPLLFIPFVENAFKYCGRSQKKIPSIKIRFDTGNLNLLKFNIENTTDLNKPENGTKGGIGLENVRQRLTFLYPGHKLSIIEDKNYYKVYLEISPL